MSKRSAKPPGPITRRQQVAAIRQVKGQEIATAVAGTIRDAVKQEVETQLKTIKDTMFDLIDRVENYCQETEEVVNFLTKAVSDLEEEVYMNEGDGDSGPKRTEASSVQQDNQVVSESFEQGHGLGCEDPAQDSPGG